MDDYKELIENLRMAGKSVELADGSFGIYLPTVEKCHNAADAIERLTKEYKELDELNDAVCKEYHKVKKERDAAVADLGRNKTCSACNNNKNIEVCKECLHIDLLAGQTIHKLWEWRGVQEVDE